MSIQAGWGRFNFMTDEEMNIAVATACGWVRSDKGWWSHPTLPDNGGAEPNPPDYGNDLNAMHRAEKNVLGNEIVLRNKFALYLTSDLPKPAWFSIHSTASQRAEAFLRTIGKWVD